ncbi:MAG TPA: hypothetical protein VHK70_06400 [Burkholderiaceae bacterium]|nr:hypothetical protein [Burkholderiaceae bacterium]
MPFANVAATALPHCTQPTEVSPPPAPMMQDHSTHHVDHQPMQATQDMANGHCSQQPNECTDDGQPGCDHCTYCQSCTFAMAMPLVGQSLLGKATVREKFRVADAVPLPFREQLFHPPRYAFA